MRGMYDVDGMVVDAVAVDFPVNEAYQFEDWNGTNLIKPTGAWTFQAHRCRDSYVAVAPEFTWPDNGAGMMLNETGDGLIPWEAPPELTALEKLEAATGLTKEEINAALA